MILIVDDDAAVRSSLTFLLKRAGYDTEAVSGPEETLEIVRVVKPRLILMDMNFSLSTTGEEGIKLLKQVKIFQPDVPVILITAWGSISLAVTGMQNGAFDFITKPWNNLVLLDRIRTAIEITEQKQQKQVTLNRKEADHQFGFNKIVGQSHALMEILSTVSRIAPTNASVLITGESGTGKELIAEAIHTNSKRAAHPFVKVNLGGISQSLFESEMFGHKKGAFTDAMMDRTGRFELADKGTIFLDEIGELDLSCQVKLLRVLQEQTFEVLGDSRPRKVDIRVVSATNRTLPEMVLNRSFREDLFYRINLITIHLPPLRERKEDIALLATHFANIQAEQNGLAKIRIAPDALIFLEKLPYSGNIRELKNLVERTMLVSGKDVLHAADFESQYTQTSLVTPVVQTGHLENMTLEELEKYSILQALEKYDGNLSHVAAALGISRAALYRRLEKYNIVYN